MRSPRIFGAVARALGRIPRAGWLCALVGVLNGLVWSLIVPPFQVPDEPAHVAYAQYVAETGRVPAGRGDRRAYSDEQRQLLDALRYKQIEFRPDNRPLTTRRAQRQIERALDTPTSRRSEGGYSHATGNPPLYYGLEAVAYRLSPSGNLLDRLYVMRALSALLAGLTVLLVFLFLREVFPATPWAWPVGSLAVALQPVFGNLSGAVHSDNLMYPAAAAIFLAFAVSFRRGLTVGRGAAIGGSLAVGVLAKATMVAFIPPAALGLLLLVLRAHPESRRTALGGALAATACAALPVFAYLLISSAAWDRGFFGGSGERGRPDPRETSLAGGLSYMWQFYLPRLPFMDSHFDEYPLADIWFDGFVGKFGVLEYGFGTAVDAVALVVYAAVAVLAARELVRHREALGDRLPELLTYAAIAITVIALIHWAGYVGRSRFYPTGFEQARYLFPLLALYAGFVALAARGAGRRFGPAAGAILVSLAIAHTLLAQLLTLTRYYG